MIIRHMQGTFGTLDGEQLRLDTGLNIIYAPNESGKSTWCAFLRAMLYGIDTSQRARAGFVPDKQKYAPWSGKPMAGELELEQGGKRITIRRWTEAPNAPLRGFLAVYTGTDIPVPGLTAADAGERLTGNGRDGAFRSADQCADEDGRDKKQGERASRTCRCLRDDRTAGALAETPDLAARGL